MHNRFFRVISFVLSCVLAVEAIGPSPEHLCEHGAIFTPHDLTNSEETLYLFGLISSLQMIWCKYVDVLVMDTNACKTDSCFQQGPLANYIKNSPKHDYRPHVHVISAAPGDSTLRPLGDAEGVLTDRYDVFLLVGATKLPSYMGIGKKINFFVCDFPYDKDMMQADEKISFLKSYDGVITSSYYSHRWYLTYVKPYFTRGHSQGWMLPDVHMVLPPVPALTKPKQPPHFSALNNTIFIAFYGDFFPGQQNNGHESALNLLTRLQREFTYARLHLYMMGRKLPSEGVEEYITGLRALAQTNKLNVDFVFDPDINKLSECIGNSLLFW